MFMQIKKYIYKGKHEYMYIYANIIIYIYRCVRILKCGDVLHHIGTTHICFFPDMTLVPTGPDKALVA